MRVWLLDEERQVAFGERLGQALAWRGRLYLEGELGAGKTTLSRGILRGLGHAGAVKSPTYTLVEPYELPQGRVYHFDLYRLADPEELEFIGGRDLFADDALCIVEWPSRGAGWLPVADLTLTLLLQDCGRVAHLEAHSEHGRDVIARLSRDATLVQKISGESETPQ